MILEFSHQRKKSEIISLVVIQYLYKIEPLSESQVKPKQIQMSMYVPNYQYYEFSLR